jgi:hypothetical protein
VKPTAEERDTAYHEAGHAMACIWEGVQLRSASIIPDDETETAGRVTRRDILKGRKIDSDSSTPNRLW